MKRIYDKFEKHLFSVNFVLLALSVVSFVVYLLNPGFMLAAFLPVCSLAVGGSVYATDAKYRRPKLGFLSVLFCLALVPVVAEGGVRGIITMGIPLVILIWHHMNWPRSNRVVSRWWPVVLFVLYANLLLTNDAQGYFPITILFIVGLVHSVYYMYAHTYKQRFDPLFSTKKETNP